MSANSPQLFTAFCDELAGVARRLGPVGREHQLVPRKNLSTSVKHFMPYALPVVSQQTMSKHRRKMV